MRLTSPFLIVRFGGYDGHPTDDKRMMDWANKISELHTQGVSEFHFLVHQTNSVHTPETCIDFARIVSAECSIEVKAPAYFP